MATSAARADRPNEDFAGAVPGAAVVLDGAAIPGSEAICSHGVAWHTHRIGGAPLDGAALFSNGASRIVTPYALTDWPGTLQLLAAHGPANLIRRVRRAEARTSASPEDRVPDDATIAYCTHPPRSEADSAAQNKA
jgi:hypothetical protein